MIGDFIFINQDFLVKPGNDKRKTMNYKTRQIISWLLFVIIILYIFTGLGMTQHKTMEKLSGGLLTKNLSFKIHSNLIYPLAILLLFHIYPSLRRKIKQ